MSGDDELSPWRRLTSPGFKFVSDKDVEAAIRRHPSGSGDVDRFSGDDDLERQPQPETGLADNEGLEHKTEVDKLTDEFLHNYAELVAGTVNDPSKAGRAYGISFLIRSAIGEALKEPKDKGE